MKLNRKRKGFTLVEIMIVVAIIALLATIAVPNFLRVRKRSQATRVLEEMRLLEGAKDQWAIENNISVGGTEENPTGTPKPEDLAPYVKPGTLLHKKLIGDDGEGSAAFTDLLGNAIKINHVDKPPQISQETYDNFTKKPAAEGVEAVDNVVDHEFWGSYAPGDDED